MTDKQDQACSVPPKATQAQAMQSHASRRETQEEPRTAATRSPETFTRTLFYLHRPGYPPEPIMGIGAATVFVSASDTIITLGPVLIKDGSNHGEENQD